MATQCLAQAKSGNMRIEIEGELADGVHAKDLILAVIRPSARRARPARD